MNPPADKLDLILAELAALRAAVGRLAAAKEKPLPPAPRQISITPQTAAQMLDMHYETVRDLMTRDVFTVLSPDGRGPGKRIFLYTDEVEVYGATRDEMAVRELRAKTRRLKPSRSRDRW